MRVEDITECSEDESQILNGQNIGQTVYHGSSMVQRNGITQDAWLMPPAVEERSRNDKKSKASRPPINKFADRSKQNKGFATIVGEVGSKAFEQALDALKRSQTFFAHISSLAEGPKSLRIFSFLGGLATTLSSFLGIVNVFSLVSKPSGYALQAYELMFGLACMIVEAKDTRVLNSCKPWIAYWFRFLTVAAGKGVLYILMGFLGISLWQDNILVAISGAYMIVVGILCWMVHFGMVSELRTAGIDITRTNAGYSTIGADPFLDYNPVEATESHALSMFAAGQTNFDLDEYLYRHAQMEKQPHLKHEASYYANRQQPHLKHEASYYANMQQPQHEEGVYQQNDNEDSYVNDYAYKQFDWQQNPHNNFR